MPLPDLKSLTAMDLLRLADNPAQNIMYFAQNRQESGGNADHILTPEEHKWLLELALKGELLKRALEKLPAADIGEVIGYISALVEESPRRKPGRNPNVLYWAAWMYHKHTNKKLMVIFDEIVLPELVEDGWISTNEDGTPNADDVKAAKKAYNKAMARLRKNYPY